MAIPLLLRDPKLPRTKGRTIDATVLNIDLRHAPGFCRRPHLLGHARP